MSVLLLLLGSIAAAAGVGLSINRASEGKQWAVAGKAAIAGIFAASACLIALSFVRVVPVGHYGIPTLFGEVQERVYPAGLHYGVNPFMKMNNMDFRKQKVTFTTQAFTADLQESDIVVTLTFGIDAPNAMKLFKDVGMGYSDIIITPAMMDAVKGAAAQYQAEKLVEDRIGLRDKIEGDIRDRLRDNQIVVYSLAIEDLDFAETFTQAVEAKVTANQNLLKEQTDAEIRKVKAEAAAAVKRTEADAAAYEITATAQAQAQANKELAESITPTLVEYNKVKAWNGELPTVNGSGSTIIDTRSLTESSD